jgi:hemoglobin
METTNTYRTLYLGLTAALVVSLSGCATGSAQRAPEQKPAAPGPTLYERVGGINGIAMLMDDVIERSYKDPVFAANPYIHNAHMHFPKPIYKYHATALACMAAGGPCKYTGRTPKDAHKNLHITEVEWQELIKIFHDSMDGFKVPAKEQAEVIAILESAKADVVVPAASASR